MIDAEVVDFFFKSDPPLSSCLFKTCFDVGKLRYVPIIMAARMNAGDDEVLQADEIEKIIVDAGIPMFDVGGVLFMIDDFLAEGMDKAPEWAQKGIDIARDLLAPLCKKLQDFAWCI
jgi:hypothetical protein